MPTSAQAIGSLVQLFPTGLQRRMSGVLRILRRLLHLLLEVCKRYMRIKLAKCCASMRALAACHHDA